MQTQTLERELQTYQHLLAHLIKDEGRFAVIFGEQLIGVFSSYEDALQIGYEKCGITSPFLVKKISAEPAMMYFSRDVFNHA